uniref:hypothetical protein n=1 Tax=Inonotus hispidus TaxID=40469 RepID=UPI002182389B|nr:hypothetical protein N4M07_mgp001 [Inonotus hispidus]UVF37939.1 hypothetical protein [Inonotus hispidus]
MNHTHESEAEKENCTLCGVQKIIPEAIKGYDLIGTIGQKLKSGEFRFLRDASDYFVSTTGHQFMCTCQSCFNFREALKCVVRLNTIFEKLSSGALVETKEVRTVVNIASALREKMLEPTILEDISLLPEIEPAQAYTSGTSSTTTSQMGTQSVESRESEAVASSSSDTESIRSKRSKKERLKQRFKSFLNTPVDKINPFNLPKHYSSLATQRLTVNSAENEPNHFSVQYHVNNFNNYDFPHKYIMKFLYVAKDLNNHNFTNDFVKQLAQDHCITVKIKIKSCGITNLIGNNHRHIVKYEIVENRPFYIINSIPIDLENDRSNYELTLFLSNIIINFTKKIDYLEFGFGLDIIFEYNFISIEDYLAKV